MKSANEFQQIMSIITAIISAIAAISSIVGAILTWHLGNLKDQKGLKRSEMSEALAEHKSIYIETMKLFEVAEKSVRQRQANDFQDRFSELSARIALACHDDVDDAYCNAAHSFQDWANEYIKSLPPQWKDGHKTVTMLQAPNPYEKHEQESARLHVIYNSSIRELLSRIKLDYKRL